MKRRIFRSICAVSLIGVLLSCVCVTGVLYKVSFDNMKQDIRDDSIVIAAALNAGELTPLSSSQATYTRITLVDPDGTVRFDSVEDAMRMPNHQDRPEIAGALEHGVAEARRLSSTLSTQTFYRALKLDDGRILRLSGSMDSVYAMTLRNVPFLLLTCGVCVLLSALLAHRQTGRIADPLNEINLERPLANDVYEELSPLLRRLEHQRLELEERLSQLTGQQREFSAITSNMREGLIVLGGDADILSINQSALAILSVRERDCLGRHVVHVNRDAAFQSAVNEGLTGHSADIVLTIGERDFRLLVSPVPEGGAVLLLLDVTEKQRSEQLRREFTANVSHELKTPLTSISGFAEILRDGMVKPEDVGEISGRIYDEARRLIALVEDIIHLSRLDEGQAPASEAVDLLAVAAEVCDRLLPLAVERQVTLSISGDSVTILASRQVLEEMIYNLCDNAIKYNREGGSVEVTVTSGDGEAALTVADTGIGIPRDQQERVFQRFYRVDTSHDKETGGTGLGLSIVKHGVMLHGAKLSLDSEPGKGTVITLAFPINSAN